MKILQINKFFYPKGGSEIYFFNLSKLLESHGHEVIHFSMKHPQNLPSKYSEYFVDELDMHKQNGLNKLITFGHIVYSTESRDKLKQLIEKTKPDIAHLHNISHQISPSILGLLSKYKIPVVQTLHDYQLICPNYKLFTNNSACEKCKGGKYYNAAINKCVDNSFIKGAAAGIELAIHKTTRVYEKNVDKFITPSKFLKRKLEEWGIESDQIIALPNFFEPPAAEAQLNTQAEQTEDYVIFCGRLVSEKGANVLIEAAKQTPEIKYKIVGDGPQREELQKSAPKNVEFLGAKSHAETLELMSKAKFVVIPSIWYENYSTALLEAAALSKAVIATDIGGNPEIIIDGQTGLLVQPNDPVQLALKIKQLYNDADLISALGGNARKKLSRDNNPQEHYRRLMEIYQAALKP